MSCKTANQKLGSLDLKQIENCHFNLTIHLAFKYSEYTKSLFGKAWVCCSYDWILFYELLLGHSVHIFLTIGSSSQNWVCKQTNHLGLLIKMLILHSFSSLSTFKKGSIDVIVNLKLTGNLTAPEGLELFSQE